LAASWLGYYIIAGMPQIKLHVFPPTLTAHALTGAAGILYIAHLAYTRRLPGRTPLDWGIVAMLAAYVLATVFAIYWRVSLEQTLQVGAVVLVFYVLADTRLLSARDLQWALMLAGGAASIYALYVISGDYRDWLDLRRAVGDTGLRTLIPPTVPRLHDVGDHPNMLGMTLVPIFPFYLLAMFRGRSTLEQASGLAGILLAAGAVFFTLSRGAWLGALGGLALTGMGITGLLLVVNGDTPASAALRERLRGPLPLVVLAAVAGIVALGSIVLADRWQSRPIWLFRASISAREDAMGAGAEMFRDRPWLGSGPGAYGLLYPEYSGKHPVEAVHAHNGFLQVAIDLGIPGILAMLALAGLLGLMLWRVVQRESLDQQLTAVAVAGAVVGFSIHNLVDAANIWRSALVAMAAVGAIAVKLYRGDGPPPLAPLPRQAAAAARHLLGYAPGVLVLAGIVALLVGWWRIDYIHHFYDRSLHQAAAQRWGDAIDDARKAVDRDPDFAPYHELLGVAYYMVAKAGGPQTLLDEGIGELQRAAELEPRSGLAHVNLARALATAGRNDQAIEEANQARRLAVADLPVTLAAAGVLETVRADDDAIAAYGDAITLNAGLADSAFWDGTQFRKDNYRRIIDASIIGFNQCTLGQLAIQRQSRGADPAPILGGATLEKLAEGCKLLVLTDPSNVDTRVSAATILIATGDLDGAWDHITYAVSRKPDYGPVRTVKGKWHQAKGDLAAARHEWLLASQVGDPEGALLLGESFPNGQVPLAVIGRLEDLLPRVNAGGTNLIIDVLWYRMKFLRESPIIVLVPGDWQNAVPAEGEAIQSALHRWRSAARVAP